MSISNNSLLWPFGSFSITFTFKWFHLVFSNTVTQMGPQLMDFHNQWALFVSSVRSVLQNGTKIEVFFPVWTRLKFWTQSCAVHAQSVCREITSMFLRAVCLYEVFKWPAAGQPKAIKMTGSQNIFVVTSFLKSTPVSLFTIIFQ